MSIKRENYLKTEVFCDVCGATQGTSLIREREYPEWVKETVDLLTFDVDGKAAILCWDCIRAKGFAKEYDRRLNALVYPKEKAG